MALVKCPDCDRDVSSEAPACPTCGRPMKVEPPPVAFRPNAPPVNPPQPAPLAKKRGVHPAVSCLVILSAVGIVFLVAPVVFISRNAKRLEREALKLRQQVPAPTYPSFPTFPAVEPPPPTPTATAKELKAAAQAEKAAEKKRAADVIEGRRLFAQVLENQMLSRGLDAHVEAVGSGRKNLRITYVLANRAWAFREMEDKDFNATLRTAGFVKIIFTDGYNYTQSYGK